MHVHDLDPGLAGLPHLSVSREIDELDPEVLQAAAVGRSDALNPSALLNLQRLAGNSRVSSLLSDEVEEPSPVRELVSSGGGVPLESATRSYMESRLGHDFSDVRIHTGPNADESARSINAEAYTVGTDVVFQTGKYPPDTPSGLRTLAHELTHVVQQKSGPVAGTPVGGGIQLSDPSDSFEQVAEQTAASAMAPSSVAAAPDSGMASVQALPSNFRTPNTSDEELEAEEAQRIVAQRAPAARHAGQEPE